MKPTILILGTDHFSNENNGDMFMTNKLDILSEQRQTEIKEVIICLKKFEPTKVALEVLQEREELLNEKYSSFTKGDYSLTINETDQIGFRLAKECHHERIYAVDWNKDEEDVPDIADIGKWAQPDELQAITKIGEDLTAQANAYLQTHSVKEYYLWANDRQNVLKEQEMYMKLALVGSKSNPVGALWTAKYWYYRNLLIYKNLVNLIDSNEERIFVLYGAGHLHLLLQFLQESGIFDVKVAKDFLET